LALSQINALNAKEYLVVLWAIWIRNPTQRW
jgi:hypothetical protein